MLVGWTPTENPNPDNILDEAESDAKTGRYEDALAKHVWFHENALKIEPAFYGVRLSFALTDWVELGKAYAPALEKLKSIRDHTADRVRTPTSNQSAPMDSETFVFRQAYPAVILFAPDPSASPADPFHGAFPGYPLFP